jgi:hypothetical protein
MTTGTGLFLVATPSAEGVLFRQAMALPYDCVAAQYAPSWPVGAPPQVYVLQCATGKVPAWAGASPQAPALWQEALQRPDVRSAHWVACDGSQRALVSRFVATCCLSMLPWPGWSTSMLGALADAPRVPVAHSDAPLSVWERMAPQGTGTSVPADAVAQAEGWCEALKARVPPVVDVNRLLGALGRPPVPGRGSAAAVALVLPPEAPRELYVPELSDRPVPLWFPDLRHLRFHQVEELNAVLHSPAYLTDPLYDDLRQTCQKNLESLCKR